jgi:hypothetical protein
VVSPPAVLLPPQFTPFVVVAAPLLNTAPVTLVVSPAVPTPLALVVVQSEEVVPAPQVVVPPPAVTPQVVAPPRIVPPIRPPKPFRN